jgi:hypothetical protein
MTRYMTIRERMEKRERNRERMARFGMFCMDSIAFSMIVGVSLWVYHL